MEIACSLFVFTIIIIVFVSFLNLANKSSLDAGALTSQLREARLICDVISNDLQSLFIRDDFSYFFNNGVLGDKEAEIARFYLDNKNASNLDLNERSTAVVSYQFVNRGGSFGRKSLCRGKKNLLWNENVFFGIKKVNGVFSIAKMKELSPNDLDVLSDNVALFCLLFKRKYISEYTNDMRASDLENLQGRLTAAPPLRTKIKSEDSLQNIDIKQIRSIEVVFLLLERNALNDTNADDYNNYLNHFKVNKPSGDVKDVWAACLNIRNDNKGVQDLILKTKIFYRDFLLSEF